MYSIVDSQLPILGMHGDFGRSLGYHGVLLPRRSPHSFGFWAEVTDAQVGRK